MPVLLAVDIGAEDLDASPDPPPFSFNSCARFVTESKAFPVGAEDATAFIAAVAGIVLEAGPLPNAFNAAEAGPSCVELPS